MLPLGVITQGTLSISLWQLYTLEVAYSFSVLEGQTGRYGTVVQASLLCRQLFNIVQ